MEPEQLPFAAYSFVPEFTLGDRLRRARESQGLTQTELGDMIGLSQRSISNYESDATTPRLIQVKLWAYFCQVSVPWLAWGDADREAPTPQQWKRMRGTGPHTIRYREWSRPQWLNSNPMVSPIQA